MALAALFFAACSGDHDYSPKPRGYFRISYPKKEYQQYSGVYPFTFIYPKYAIIEEDTVGKLKRKNLINMQYLFNLQFPQFQGTLHLSYESLNSKKSLNELTEDAHSLAFKHTVKATSIDEAIIHNPERKVYGVYYTIDGNAASSLQFYLTDSTHHYIRGALYFRSEPRLDSIQPVLNFVKKDIDTLIKTFKWK
jgi:gliding motility-associated lipoprotein GldD